MLALPLAFLRWHRPQRSFAYNWQLSPGNCPLITWSDPSSPHQPASTPLALPLAWFRTMLQFLWSLELPKTLVESTLVQVRLRSQPNIARTSLLQGPSKLRYIHDTLLDAGPAFSYFLINFLSNSGNHSVSVWLVTNSWKNQTCSWIHLTILKGFEDSDSLENVHLPSFTMVWCQRP